MRLEAQRLKAALDQDADIGLDVWCGHLLFWAGAAMLLVAVFLDTSTTASDGSRIHNLAKANQQLMLTLCGLASLISGSSFLAGDGSGLCLRERVFLVCWITGIGSAFLVNFMK